MRTCIAFGLLFFWTGIAAAQLCVGNAAFWLTHVHVAAVVDIDTLPLGTFGVSTYGFAAAFKLGKGI